MELLRVVCTTFHIISNTKMENWTPGSRVNHYDICEHNTDWTTRWVYGTTVPNVGLLGSRSDDGQCLCHLKVLETECQIRQCTMYRSKATMLKFADTLTHKLPNFSGGIKRKIQLGLPLTSFVAFTTCVWGWSTFTSKPAMKLFIRKAITQKHTPTNFSIP